MSFLLALIVTSFAAHVSSVRADCESELLNIGLLMEMKAEDFVSDDPSVVMQGTRPGQHGGRRIFLLKQMNETWQSTAGHSFAPQGDPRWFIGVFGVEVAKFFGFEMLGKNLMTIPDPLEFSNAINNVNARLVAIGREPIPVTFYSVESEKNVSVSRYIRIVLDVFGLPLATEANHYVHDMGFHAPAILIPKNYWDAVTDQVRYFAEFGDYIVQKYSQSSQPVVNLSIAYRFKIKNYLTSFIDAMSGNWGVSHRNKLEEIDPAVRRRALRSLVLSRSGRDPERQIGLILGTAPHIQNEKFRDWIEEVLLQGGLSVSDVLKDVAGYERSLPEEKRFQNLSKLPDRDDDKGLENLLLQADARIRDITEAVTGRH